MMASSSKTWITTFLKEVSFNINNFDKRLTCIMYDAQFNHMNACASVNLATNLSD